MVRCHFFPYTVGFFNPIENKSLSCFMELFQPLQDSSLTL